MYCFWNYSIIYKYPILLNVFTSKSVFEEKHRFIDQHSKIKRLIYYLFILSGANKKHLILERSVRKTLQFLTHTMSIAKISNTIINNK